jgi:hypothetical protein
MEKNNHRTWLPGRLGWQEKMSHHVALRTLGVGVGRRVLQNLSITCFADRRHFQQNATHRFVMTLPNSFGLEFVCCGDAVLVQSFRP